MHRQTATAALLTFAIAAACASPVAWAVNHSDAVNATGACNGALPSYEGALRKRALAIANEGATAAFVSCSIITDGFQNPGYSSGTMTFVNRTAAPMAFNCTMVTGAASELGLDPQYYTKLVAVQANAAAIVNWTPGEYSVPGFGKPLNFSCSLPAGVEISVLGGNYETP